MIKMREIDADELLEWINNCMKENAEMMKKHDSTNGYFSGKDTAYFAIKGKINDMLERGEKCEK